MCDDAEQIDGKEFTHSHLFLVFQQQGQEPGSAAQVCEFAKARFQVHILFLFLFFAG